MQLKLTARHDNPSDATRKYAETKLSKLDRRLHDLTLVELTFSRERNPSIADDHVVDAVAIDRLLDKLERQVERYRDKRTVEKRRSQNGSPAPPTDEVIELPRDESAA